MAENRREITKKDIEICKIRMEPREENLFSIYANGNSDRWFCDNCKDRGDKWYMMVHTCKYNKRKKSTQYENEED